MQPDILSGLNPDLYPCHSHHQEEIADYFGQSMLRQMSAAEKKRLAALDLFFIAFTNRCGSTLLAELLNQRGLGIPPPPIIGVDYEDILRKPDRAILRVADFLGLAPDGAAPVSLDDVTIRQQRNEHSQSLVDQFRQEFFA